jgi:hypothetical protein
VGGGNCNRSNISIHNSPSWTIHPYFSSNIHIHHVNITDDAPGDAHFNTDGIDPNSCENVLIEDYYYCGGDDAIAIKSGWNVAGMLYAKPSKNITVRRSSSGCRGGWTVGSEAMGGVEDVVFEDLVSTSESGIRISAELMRGGFFKNIVFRNLTFGWTSLAIPNHNPNKTFFLHVEQNYPNGGTYPPCNGCPIPPLTPNMTTPVFDGIRFEQILILDAPKGFKMGGFDCTVAPCKNVTFDTIITASGVPPPQPLQCKGTITGGISGVNASLVPAGCVQQHSAVQQFGSSGSNNGIGWRE